MWLTWSRGIGSFENQVTKSKNVLNVQTAIFRQEKYDI